MQDDELSGVEHDLLAAWKSDEGPSEGVKERVWRRVERHGNRSWRRPVAIVLGALAAGIVVGIVRPPWRSVDRGPSEAHLQAPFEAASTPSTEVAVRPPLHGRPSEDSMPADDSTAEDGLRAPAHEAGPETPLRGGSSDADVRQRHAGEGSQPAPDPTREELRRLRAAQKALSEGRAAWALELLRVQQREFPRGRFEPEWAALRALALCEAGGELEQGRLAVQSFIHRFPGSALRERVERACPR